MANHFKVEAVVVAILLLHSNKEECPSVGGKSEEANIPSLLFFFPAGRMDLDTLSRFSTFALILLSSCASLLALAFLNSHAP